MQLELVSEGFDFRGGEAYLIPLVDADALPAEPPAANVSGNILTFSGAYAPGEYALTLVACGMVSRTTGADLGPQNLSVRFELTALDVRQGRARVHVPHSARLRIEVVNAAGGRIPNDCVVGIVRVGVTQEMTVPAGAAIEVLLPPGTHGLYSVDEPAVLHDICVPPGVVDLGTIFLRAAG